MPRVPAGQGNVVSMMKPPEEVYIAMAGAQLHQQGELFQSVGMTEEGNINLNNRPKVKNADGTVSTVRSMDVYDGPDGAVLGKPDAGPRVLLPTVSDDGRIMSDQEAVDSYNKTGKHLGKFETTKDANEYAQDLHKKQAKKYGLE